LYTVWVSTPRRVSLAPGQSSSSGGFAQTLSVTLTWIKLLSSKLQELHIARVGTNAE